MPVSVAPVAVLVERLVGLAVVLGVAALVVPALLGVCATLTHCHIL